MNDECLEFYKFFFIFRINSLWLGKSVDGQLAITLPFLNKINPGLLLIIDFKLV